MRIFKSWLYVFPTLIASSCISLNASSENGGKTLNFRHSWEIPHEFVRAAECGDLEKFEMIYRGFSREVIDQEHINNALRAAALRGHVNIIRFLLGNGVDANRQVLSDERAALHDAVLTGCVDVIDCLVEGGGDVNTVTINGVTPLHNAVYRYEYDAVKRLIRYGADMHAQAKNGKTPLQTATHSWRIWVQELQTLTDIVRYMVLRGAPIVESDRDVIQAIYKNERALEEEQQAVGKALEEISSMTGMPRDLNRLLLSFLSADLRMPNRQISTRTQKLRSCLDAMISSLYAWWSAG